MTWKEYFESKKISLDSEMDIKIETEVKEEEKKVEEKEKGNIVDKLSDATAEKLKNAILSANQPPSKSLEEKLSDFMNEM